MDEILKIDANHKNAAGAVTDDIAQNIRNLRIDDATKGLKVMIVGGGGGNVVGPGVSVIGDIPIFSDITGQLLADSGVLLSALLTDAPSDGNTYGRKNAAWSAVAAGTGDVSKVGTPVNNQIGVWTGDGTLEGDANFTKSSDIGGDVLTLGANSSPGRLALWTDAMSDKITNIYGGVGLATDISIKMPSTSQTLVGRTSTDTLTNKSISGGQITSAVALATTVTTNANLTGVVTSSGNATAIADAALSIAKTSGLQAALDAKEVTLTFGDGLTRTVNDVDVDAAQPGITSLGLIADLRATVLGVNGGVGTSANPLVVIVPDSGAIVLSGASGVANSASMKWFNATVERAFMTWQDTTNFFRIATISGGFGFYADNITGRGLTIITGSGNVGIGTTSPTSKLHLAAGSATAGTAPLGFTSGTLLTTPVAGKVEFLTDAYYGTITTGAARKQFAFTSDLTGGTVTAVSVATANGVSGSSSGGATPALTISLGAITPTSVNGILVGQGTNSVTGNTAVGVGALDAANTGSGYNTAIGYNTLTTNTTGYNNTAVGENALTSNTTGAYNTAQGVSTLFSNTTGSSNVALGYSAGKYELGSNAFYVNNIDQTNTAGDKAYSLLYGTFAGTAGTTTGNALYVNGTLVVGDHGTGTTDQVVNVSYGTSATAPTASTTTEGSLYLTYTA